MKKLFVAAGLCLLLIGCSRQGNISENLVTVHFQEATALETTATFTLRLSNETPQPIEINGSVHKIYINDLYVGKGLSDEIVTVPRLSTITNNVTVHLSNIALATRVKSVIESKSFDYRIQSTLFGKSWFNRMSASSEGKLDMKDFMPTEGETNTPAISNEPAVTPSPTNN